MDEAITFWAPRSPIWLPAAAIASTLRAQMASRAPSRAKAVAMAAPMPRDAPVTMTRLPLRSMFIFALGAAACLVGIRRGENGQASDVRALGLLDHEAHRSGYIDRLQGSSFAQHSPCARCLHALEYFCVRRSRRNGSDLHASACKLDSERRSKRLQSVLQGAIHTHSPRN